MMALGVNLEELKGIGDQLKPEEEEQEFGGDVQVASGFTARRIPLRAGTDSCSLCCCQSNELDSILLSVPQLLLSLPDGSEQPLEVGHPVIKQQPNVWHCSLPCLSTLAEGPAVS